MSEIVRFVNKTSANSPGGNGTTNATAGANRAYESLSEGEAAEQTDLDTANDNIVFRVNGDEADTATANFVGWTTSAADNIEINQNTLNPHAGVFDETIYHLSKTNGIQSLVLGEDFMDVIGLQITIKQTASADPIRCIRTRPVDAGSICNVSKCLLREAGSTGGTGNLMGIEHDSTNMNLHAFNNLAYDFVGGAGRGFFQSAAGLGAFYNNTAMDCDTGFQSVANAWLAKNNLGNGNTTDYSGTFTGALTNLSEDATSPNSALRSLAVDFQDETANKFLLLKTDSKAKNAGTDLSADGTKAVTDDCLSQTRKGRYDIGWHQNLQLLERNNIHGSNRGVLTGVL